MSRKLFASLLSALSLFAAQAADLPVLAETRPAHKAVDIDEQQSFLFRAKGAVDAKTFIAHVFCEVEGVRSVDTVRVIGGNRKTELLRAAGISNAENWIAFRCTQNFPSGADVTIRWDSPTAASKQAVDTLRFKVRSGDWLKLSCSRENKAANCNPLSSVYLSYDRAISPKDAARFRLRDDAGKLYSPKPTEDEGDGVSFHKLPPETRFTLVLPANLKEDGTGTPLTLAKPLTLRTAAYPPLVKFARSFGI